MTAVHVTSFGHLHGPAPDADLTLDLRAVLLDSHVDVDLRWRTGLDPDMRAHVLDTPGARDVVAQLSNLACALTSVFASEESHRVLRIAVGCADGRYRSVVVAAELVRVLCAYGVFATAHHRDVRQPVVEQVGSG